MAKQLRSGHAPAGKNNATTERKARYLGFIAEKAPFAVAAARRAWEEAEPPRSFASARTSGEFAARLADALLRLAWRKPGNDLPPHLEPTPRVALSDRVGAAREELAYELRGFVRREHLRVTLTADERREILQGMLLTRAVDNQLKAFFTGGKVRYGQRSFQGKGFRSLGQEAIFASVVRLKRGEAARGPAGEWKGDVIAPMIRDLGAVLGMRPTPETVRMVLNAQMGKDGPPMHGKDLHVGDWESGIFPASAPLGISPLTSAGIAMGFAREGGGRVVVSYIGEGATSHGEWHEAINLAAARRLPIVFCVENNQTALSTPLSDQSAVRVFADKARGYGVEGLSLDGTEPDGIAAAFAWAAERARAGEGPTLIELVAMRICGHAHHDDMLYLGKEPAASWDYPELSSGGYADAEAYAYWSARDPLRTYAARLEREGVASREEVASWRADCEALVAMEAETIVEAPWPEASHAGLGVFADEPARVLRDPLDAESGGPARERRLVIEQAPHFDPKGSTFLEAIMMGVADALERDPRAFVYGEDVGGRYGNAFLLLRPLLERFPDRILNSTLAEGGVLGVCVGAALAGQRPIGEMQFNDFVASGFNQLVNSAAKIRYRWGGAVPMVVRMPWGGLRNAGPFHSQNTEAWFYRTPGLKIVAPSTPHDARALFAAAMADPDPVLYYEHIALYREPRIKQLLDAEPPRPIPLGQAALRREGKQLAIVSYGAFVHTALRVAEALSREGIEASVLDLRSLAPLDLDAVLTLVRNTGRLLIVHEDTKTGGIGESLSAKVQEEAFSALDAPIRVIGALDTPVPYAPSLEEAFLPSDEFILQAARRLARF